MPATTPCRYCQRTGFVRFETVVKGGKAAKEFYCGRCNRTWVVEDREPPSSEKSNDSKLKRP